MKTTHIPSSRLRKGGLGRSIIGATAVGSIGAALQTANAAIVYSGPRNISTSSLIGTSGAPDIKPINIDGAGGDEFRLYSFGSKGSDFQWINNYSSGFTTITTNPINTMDVVPRMQAGESVDAGDTFGNALSSGIFIENFPNTHWTGGTDGYFGYRFNPSGNLNLYGWGHVNFSPDAKIMTLVDWAYENTGAPISVPEPTTSLLMTACLAVAAIWRRRARH